MSARNGRGPTVRLAVTAVVLWPVYWRPTLACSDVSVARAHAACALTNHTRNAARAPHPTPHHQHIPPATDTRPIMCNSAFEGGAVRYLRHGSQPEEPPYLSHVPMLQPFWAAGLSFSRGHFVVRVPYDCCLPMVFQARLYRYNAVTVRLRLLPPDGLPGASVPLQCGYSAVTTAASW